jgi:hypothetical protein
MAKNAYAAYIQRTVYQQVVQARATHTQMCLDAALIAANDVLQLGPGRAKEFADAYSQALTEIANMAVDDTRDLEYSKAKLDERLKQICGEHFVPWEGRYRCDGAG